MTEDIGQRVAVLETEQQSTAKVLAAHVKHCSKVQTYGLVIGCVTLGTVITDSPKAAKIMQLLAGLFLG